MHSQITDVAAQPQPLQPKLFRKLAIKIAYLIVVIPAILLFFGLVVGIPN